MLDTFQGLPVHALLVHAVVVLVPLLALATVAVATLARWRVQFAWPVAAADALLVVVTVLTQQSGRQLQGRLPDGAGIRAHVALGRQMVWFTVALLIVAVVVALLRRRAGPGQRVVAVGALVVALAAVGWVARVGHSGSSAVWQQVIADTTPGGGGR